MNAQHVAALQAMRTMFGEDRIPSPCHERDALDAAIAALAAPKEAGHDFDALAYRFLAWPLAGSVCADPCASMQNYPNRTGTNLLSFVEAKAMLQHVLTTPCPIDGLTESHVGMDPPHQYAANPPGDQRQEGDSFEEMWLRVRSERAQAASPPPEAAAAVGERDALERAIREAVYRHFDRRGQIITGRNTVVMAVMGVLDDTAALASPTGVDEAIKVPRGLAAALRSQRQCDEDGVECIVSRQAADEAADIIDALAARDGGA